MHRIILLGLIIATLLVSACSGQDENDKDKVPPIPPVLTPHLGDTGDQPVVYQGQPIQINDENNGIDTVPDGDWIRVSWNPFLDNDLSHVKVYRYDEFDPEPIQIDSIPSSATYYLDTDTQLTERVWYSYFIDLVDSSGNVSRSDTISYGLLSKSIPLTPENNATISPVGAEFKWNRSGFASKFRLIVFDENYNYVWHHDLMVALEIDPLTVTLPVNLATQYSGQSLRWRIDSFDWDEGMQMYLGSESAERVVHIQ